MACSPSWDYEMEEMIKEINIGSCSELSESEEKFRLLIHILGEGVGIVDQNEIFILTNEAAEDIFQVERNKLTGRCLNDFLSEKSKLQIANETAMRKVGIKSSYELEIITEKKEIKTIIVTGTPYFSKHDNFQGTLGVFRDITERKKMEQQLISLNDDKDRFMSILAHDLRSPFMGLLNYSVMLLKNFRNMDMDKIEKQLQTINRTTKKTYDLLEDVLLWSRSQSGKLPFEPKNLILSEICSEVISEKLGQASTKNISINSAVPEEMNIYADNNMIKTVLRNLLSNAIKFTNKDGAININAGYLNDSVFITVSDNGIGISSEDIGKLWNFAKPFTTQGTENESGTGLGLVLCKEFVEKHGGKISVKSEPGKGTDFVFLLPSVKD
jgi:PAS domain S-box-containing protein